jgi:hypothetical protein
MAKLIAAIDLFDFIVVFTVAVSLTAVDLPHHFFLPKHFESFRCGISFT